MSFVVEPERTVDVPAGLIRTTPVNGTSGGYANVTYWSPVVGNGALFQTFAPTGNEVQRLELIDYQYRARAPVTTLVVGAPSYEGGLTYVTSATPISFSVLDTTGIGVRDTRYRIDGGAWANYSTTGPFHLLGVGTHDLEWFSVDNAGNAEATASRQLRVDDTPPKTAFDVGAPKYSVGAQMYVTSATNISLNATDEGVSPVGLGTFEYRLDGGAWIAYSTSFTLSGSDGEHAVECRAADLLGNTANETLALILDDSPPKTTIEPSAGSFDADTVFALAATDAGSGVGGTEYRVDGGAWTPYGGRFSLPIGDHVIDYRSVDHLGNAESEQTLAVTVTAPASPPGAPTSNLKPLVAAGFAATLAIAGALASKRRPWKGMAGPRGVLAAFIFTALPFMLAEAATGLVSLVTGLLSIPPLVGMGTGVDLSILFGGVALLAYRGRGTSHPDH